ncbi:DUF6491 family protein [Novosphingobium sp. M1R2S20]|uniref:DUF6491 family protein n=1 Tax=Novosphingobium rhizovicinum TaxID=3228928 RepID=A0ABV3RDN3_9SPHN
MTLRLTVLTASAFAAGAVVSACATPGGADIASSPTTTAAAGASTCFFPSQVNGFQRASSTERGSDDIVVTVGANRKYLFQTLGPCPDINWSETIAFDQFGPGQICDGRDVTLIVPSTIGPRRCPVRMIRELSPEEAKSY